MENHKRYFNTKKGREAKRRADRAYYQRNKEKKKEQVIEWCKNNPEKYKQISKRSTKRRNQKIKLARLNLIRKLGNICSKCGFSDIRALQIDYQNGGHRKMIKKAGTSYGEFYLKLDKLSKYELAKDWQILCANCNWIKR